MDSILERLENIDNCKDLLRQSCKRNGLNTSLAGQMSVSKLKLLNQKFKRAYSHFKSEIKTSWIENQLRTFNWILIVVSALENALIVDFAQKHWILLQNIFQYKTRNFLKFETRRFLEEKKAKNKNWNDQEDNILLRIATQMLNNDDLKAKKQQQSLEDKIFTQERINEQKSVQNNNKLAKDKIHWNEVARRLFEESNEKYFRSSKHCRQRWFNHIDPSKQRGKWRESEDQELEELVAKHGKKWSEIATILHRTQHNVKNRYHSLQTKGTKETKLKKTNKNISIQQNSIIKIQDKQENDKEPLKTITDLTQKNQKGKEGFKVAEQIDCMDQIQNYQQIVRTEDASICPKNDYFLLSPFAPFSPKNLTPFVGSNSPSPFTFSLYNIHSFVTDQRKFVESDFIPDGDGFANRSGLFNIDKQ